MSQPPPWNGYGRDPRQQPPYGPEYGQFGPQEPWRPSWQQDPQGYGLPGGPPPRRRHWRRYVFAGTAALIVIGGIAGRAASSGSPSASPAAAAAPASGSAPPAASSAPPAIATKVEFIVSGSAPDGVDITYGPSGTNLSGPAALDGTATMSVPFDSSAEFYALNAQLQGDGDITCKIVAIGPGDAPLTVSHGAASGGFNICSAQATTSDGVNWQDEN